VSRRAIGIIIAVVGILVAAVGVFSIRQILISTLAPQSAPTAPAPVTEKVVLVVRDFSVGDIVKAEHTKLEDIPVELIPRNAMRDIEDVVDRMVKVPLVSGEMLLAHHLADPTYISHDIGYTMSENLVMMAFPAGDLMSSLNVLQRGDLVDIFVSLEKEVDLVEIRQTGDTVPQDPIIAEEENETLRRMFTFDAMQATDISAVIADIEYEEGNYTDVPLNPDAELNASTEPYPSKVQVNAYLLILNPQDALLLKHLIDIGGIFDLVLRAPTSDQLFDLQPVMSEYLIDRYQLEVPR
jgi:hypothetical protein